MLQWKNLPASALDGDLAVAWDQLNAERGDLPFLAAYVMNAALTEFGNGRERLLVGYDAQGVAAMLILWQKRFFEWQTFQPSQMPLGAWVAKKDIPLLEMVRNCQRNLSIFCLILGVTQVDPLMAARDADTDDSLSTNYIETGWIEISGDFDTYWSNRGKNLRKNLKKQRNKLSTEGIEVTLRCLKKEEDMAEAISRYGALESAGWKGQQGTAVHEENHQGRFYRKILEDASMRNEALVYEYYFGKRVVAMNLCLVRGATHIVLKTSYDESIGSLSPAFLLRQETLQLIFQEAIIKRMEFFGKVMEWHTQWTDKCRIIYHLTVFRWGWFKQLKFWLQRLKS